MTGLIAPLFEGGLVIDAILLLLAGEAVLLRRRGWAWQAVAGALLPGALLFLALRAALTGMGWQWVALFVTLSLPAHLYDLGRRNG